MRTKLPFPRRAADWINARVLALRSSPRWGRWVGRYLTVVTYVGRRSGRTFSTPVAYRRKADVVRISVSFPGSKTWWRNFLGSGGPISLQLDDEDRSGHAVADRDERGRVTVTVRLDGCTGPAPPCGSTIRFRCQVNTDPAPVRDQSTQDDQALKWFSRMFRRSAPSGISSADETQA